MKLPCEEALWYTLPRIRADIARELVDSGMPQKDVAEKLGVTPAAISQYLHKKRGKPEKKTSQYKKKVKEIARRIREGEEEKEMMGQICSLCSFARH